MDLTILFLQKLVHFVFQQKYNGTELPYSNVTLPAGNYEALRINIGQAQGENWWCSLFPPLCFVDISSGVIDDNSKENLKENLSEEEFAIITSNNGTIKLKFKIFTYTFSN